jgi:hypothetical protein
VHVAHLIGLDLDSVALADGGCSGGEDCLPSLRVERRYACGGQVGRVWERPPLHSNGGAGGSVARRSSHHHLMLGLCPHILRVTLLNCASCVVCVWFVCRVPFVRVGRPSSRYGMCALGCACGCRLCDHRRKRKWTTSQQRVYILHGQIILAIWRRGRSPIQKRRAPALRLLACASRTARIHAACGAARSAVR